MGRKSRYEMGGEIGDEKVQDHCRKTVSIPGKKENHSRECRGDANGAFFH